MAGAAGFEPAVPGLGGQCIIQAMLHARLPQSLPLKKSSEEKRPFGPLLSDAMKHHGLHAHTWKILFLPCLLHMERRVGSVQRMSEPYQG